MTAPTPEQITRVKGNLSNMVTFTNIINQYGSEQIINCFALLEESDGSDVGLDLTLNLLCGSFWAIGGECGPVGAISANFLAGCVNRWNSPDCTPQSLLGSFASMYARFGQTCVEVTNQLGVYNNDPASYWNTPFTYQGQTVTLGDLSTIDFPPQGNTDFQTFQDTALVNLDQGTWQATLQKFCIVTTFTMVSHESMKRVNKNGGPDAITNNFYSNKHGNAQYIYLQYNPGEGMTTEGYDSHQFLFGHAMRPDKPGYLSDAAYNYIFKNTSPTNITNPNGLWSREYVFGPVNLVYPYFAQPNNLGIPYANA
jgi:hypothetical protein